MNWRKFGALLALAFCAANFSAGEPADRADRAEIVSHIPRAPVESRGIAAVGYSQRKQLLEVEFINGAIYRYLDVPASVYRHLMEADSKARFYDEHVRGRYQRVRVRPRRD